MFMLMSLINSYLGYFFFINISDNKLILFILALLSGVLITFFNSLVSSILGSIMMILFSPITLLFGKVLLNNYSKDNLLYKFISRLPLLLTDILFYYILIQFIIDNVYHGIFDNYHFISSVIFGIICQLGYFDFLKRTNNNF